MERNCVLIPEPGVVILEGIRDLLSVVQSCQCRKVGPGPEKTSLGLRAQRD